MYLVREENDKIDDPEDEPIVLYEKKASEKDGLLCVIKNSHVRLGSSTANIATGYNIDVKIPYDTVRNMYFSKLHDKRGREIAPSKQLPELIEGILKFSEDIRQIATPHRSQVEAAEVVFYDHECESQYVEYLINQAFLPDKNNQNNGKADVLTLVNGLRSSLWRTISSFIPDRKRESKQRLSKSIQPVQEANRIFFNGS